jgi:CTP synthase
MILCRSEYSIDQSVRDKIALFCNVRSDHVIEGRDVPSIYEVPLVMHEQNAGQLIKDRLKIEKVPKLQALRKFIHNFKNPEDDVLIAMCGKYTELMDSYKSVMEAFIHSGVENNTHVKIKWIKTQNIKSQKSAAELFINVDGILLLPGFGSRGVEGKIHSSRYARENKIPFLGICLGLQCAIIDFSRNVCGMIDANSTEFNKQTKYPVIDLMESQKAIKIKGGTMRLGAYDCEIKVGTRTHDSFGVNKVSERHRHRYEVNNKYMDKLEKHGLIFSGINPDLKVVESIEIKNHPWYVATQFHPELKSRVNRAHPLFRDFIKAAKMESKKNEK